MSVTLHRFCKTVVNLIEKPGIRHKWIKRGRDPTVARNLAQRLEELKLKAEDPALHYRVNVGYAFARPSRRDVLSERLQHRKAVKRNIDKEKEAKNKTLTISVDEVQKEWIPTGAPFHIKESADYYGVYRDLFGEAYFIPVTPLKIQYNFNSVTNQDIAIPVEFGNLVRSFEATNAPQVEYKAKDNELYTLMMTTPDCHLTEEKGEYIHWLIGNIPGSKLEKGELLYDYIQPFPLRGIGYCRYIFVLFKQDKKLDFSKYRMETPCKNLTARTFSTYDFYREFEDYMTPSGLSFFQSDWDQTLSQFFHQVLDMKEPVFEYDFEERAMPEQEWYPHRKQFNIYLDKYKDPKELQKELLVEKLKERHPFIPPPKPPKYPMAFRISNTVPSWLKDDIQRKRMKEGKWRFM